MGKIVRFTDVTYGNGARCFKDVDFGRFSMAEVTPYHSTDHYYKWEIVKYICGPCLTAHLGGWVLRDNEIEDVSDDEVAAAIAYWALV